MSGSNRISILSAATRMDRDRRHDARIVSRTPRGSGTSSLRKRSRLAATVFWAGNGHFGETGVGVNPFPPTSVFHGSVTGS